MDMGQLMKMAGELKDQLGNAQREASKVQADGEAGGGLVKVVVDGSHRTTSVHIDKSLMTADNHALLEDLLVAASNQAAEKVAKALKDSMGGLAESFGLDPSALGDLRG